MPTLSPGEPILMTPLAVVTACPASGPIGDVEIPGSNSVSGLEAYGDVANPSCVEIERSGPDAVLAAPVVLCWSAW